MIEIKIPLKAPTLNTMYSTFRGHRVKSKDARLFAKDVQEIMDSMTIEPIEGKLKEIITIHSKWFNKDGTIKKRDIANLEKAINDSIFACLPNMDDSQLFEITIRKIPSEEELTVVKIEQL